MQTELSGGGGGHPESTHLHTKGKGVKISKNYVYILCGVRTLWLPRTFQLELITLEIILEYLLNKLL